VSLSEAAGAGAAGLLRHGVLALAALGVLGAAVDLAMARHWASPIQLVPWAALGMLAVALALIAASPSGRTLRAARGLALLVAATAALGVYQHVAANYATAPLDFRYGDRWESMTGLARLWAAASGAVRPSPTAAPGLLGYLAFATSLATLRHPALAPASRPAAVVVPTS
jgi:hypothetical protein